MQQLEVPAIAWKEDLAGINDLPVEVLEEIFLTYHSMVALSTFPYVRLQIFTHLAPVSLTHVCRLWRTICLSLPTLWNAFYVPPRLHASGVTTSLLSLWLERSQGAPLWIDIARRTIPMPPIEARSIMTQAYRLKVLSLNPQDGFIEDFLSLPPDATPALEGLAIRQGDLRSMHPNLLPLLSNKILSLPSIRQLCFELSGFPTPAYQSMLAELPLARMTHLNFRTITTFEDCISILRRSTSAVEISFYESIWGSDHPTQPAKRTEPKICLPNLKSLTMYPRFPVSRILSRFTCPSLRRLIIRDEPPQPDVDAASIDFEQRILDDFVRDTQLEQLILQDGKKQCFQPLKSLLKMPAVQRVPNVEVYLLKVPRKHGPVSSDGYHCPVATCTRPHLGWNSSRSQVQLGTHLTVTEWEENFWRGWDWMDHEPRQWLMRRGYHGFRGFCN
ncbi:hypothetical protein CC1G_00794 [Coprinopsis cinerea okayama7|uniref:Uncharacterized protein n=1 Tax=Coprinopsis cinerea (strain Okayama-7 / 130 / ATCC MYA-4618 / FGSC 9003) TaxID=240176 RepID=A8N8R9_COPC7|nr:hypothetical protein CC1G_00794 [Coprinopsis cinerea okayama7\|eukprot:XP_001831247.2 hypothetical protein CC1G_00794 [Coprinopsis cinerea okayama7\